MPDDHSIPESGAFEAAAQARAEAECRARELEEERRQLLLAQADPAAFRWLYDRYYLRINCFLRGLVHDPTVADDLTGQVFVQALAALPHFRWQGHSYGAYLHRVALNEALGHWRTRSRRRTAPEEVGAQLPDPQPDALTALATAEREREVRVAIVGLNRADRTVLALHYWEELGVAEIAELLAEPHGTIQARLMRAREKLRLQLRRQELRNAHGAAKKPGPARSKNGFLRRFRLERDAD